MVKESYQDKNIYKSPKTIKAKDRSIFRTYKKGPFKDTIGVTSMRSIFNQHNEYQNKSNYNLKQSDISINLEKLNNRFKTPIRKPANNHSILPRYLSMIKNQSVANQGQLNKS